MSRQFPRIAVLALLLVGTARAASSLCVVANSVLPGTNKYMSNGQFTHCWWDRFRLSGMANLQGGWVQASAPSASASDRQLALSNLNLMADVRVNPLTLLHTNLHYGDNDRLSGLYQSSSNGGVGWLNTQATARQTVLNLDEAYVFYTNRDVSPVFLKLGTQYLDIGRYEDPYTPFPSLTQLMTQTNKTAMTSGFSSNNGLYGSAAWFRGDVNHASKNKLNNYTVKMGYNFGWQFFERPLKYDVELSYLRDIRQVVHNARDDNPILKQYFISDLSNDTTFSKRHGLLVARLADDYGSWHGEMAYTEVLGHLNGMNTEPQIFSVSGLFDFNVFDLKSNLHGRFETASQSSAVMLFIKRYAGGYMWHINDNTAITLDYAYYKGTSSTPTSFSGNADNLHFLLAGLQVRI